jgi:hypothetical protein
VLTVVVSAATLAAVTFAGIGALEVDGKGMLAGACVDDGCVDDAVAPVTELESFPVAFRLAGFGAGNSN